MRYETVDQLIEAWDAGRTVTTLEMGGLGPGYEQAIQVMAIEFAREGRHLVKQDDSNRDGELFGEVCDKVLHRIDGDIGGASGAQFGAARWLAYRWCRIGPSALLDEAKKHDPDDDRTIIISRAWPKCQEPPK